MTGGRSQEGQQDQVEPRTDGGITLNRPKRNIHPPQQYGFKESISYALVTVDGDPYTYEKVMDSCDSHRWI